MTISVRLLPLFRTYQSLEELKYTPQDDRKTKINRVTEEICLNGFSRRIIFFLVWFSMMQKVQIFIIKN
jgi:hypothetical protein